MMKNIIKYIVMFIWVVLFMYFYDIFMLKGILYFIVGIPALFLSGVFISKSFNGPKTTKN